MTRWHGGGSAGVQSCTPPPRPAHARDQKSTQMEVTLYDLLIPSRGVIAAARGTREALERAEGLHRYAVTSALYLTDLHNRSKLLARGNPELEAELRYIRENYILDVVSVGHSLATRSR